MSCRSAARRGHHRGEARHLDRVREHVLAVARAELEPAEQLDQFGVQSLDARLEHALLAELDDVALELRFGLIVGLFDPRRVDAAILQQLLEGQPRDLAPDPVEP